MELMYTTNIFSMVTKIDGLKKITAYRKKYYCKQEGCLNYQKKNDVCIKHGAVRARCSIQGCSNQSKKNGICIKHGAIRARCSIQGCSNQSLKNGVCMIHGAYDNDALLLCTFPLCGYETKIKGS